MDFLCVCIGVAVWLLIGWGLVCLSPILGGAYFVLTTLYGLAKASD
jgi:hypothetical protein